MQAQIPLESEDSFRLACVQLAQNYYDLTEHYPTDIDAMLTDAAKIEHYITKGATIAFNCTQRLRKTVSGKAQ